MGLGLDELKNILTGFYQTQEAYTKANARVTLAATPLKSLGAMEQTKAWPADFPYMMGAMANGIASEQMVIEAAKHGFMACFGSAGLSIEVISASLARLQAALKDKKFAVNLIHSPQQPQWEEDLVDLLIERSHDWVEASAFMDISEALVRYRLHGLRQDGNRIVCRNHVIAKVSRVELAEKFMSPAPDKIVSKLLDKGLITFEQAQLSKRIPLAQFITAESDSGGHTDNRPAMVMLPLMEQLRYRLAARYEYELPLVVGLAGGLSTPQSLASAFSLGAAYVVTGTINQACVESGTSDEVRQMLAEAGQADVTMAPAADMFEMGIKVQVLKRGSLFAMRAQKLYDIYRSYSSLEEIPRELVDQLEKQIFREPLDAVWQATKLFFESRDPQVLVKAERNPKIKMALVFRSYLGRASSWANQGENSRKIDYQVWCGPAMGAFNEWAKTSFLEKAQNRRVVNVARNLLVGALICLRSQALKLQGVSIDPSVLDDLLIARNDEQLNLLLVGES